MKFTELVQVILFFGWGSTQTPFAKLSCDNFGLKADRLLMSVDLAKCPLEIFPLVNGLTRPFGEIVLLHVLDRRTNVGRHHLADRGLRRAALHLERLRDENLRPNVEVNTRVRIGIPYEEIFGEAVATRFGSSFGVTAQNLIACASTSVFVVDVRTCFNGSRHWAKEDSGACVA